MCLTQSSLSLSNFFFSFFSFGCFCISRQCIFVIIFSVLSTHAQYKRTHSHTVTGQEEIQYKVFRALGLNQTDKENDDDDDDEDDLVIRSWFNGPAFLTWSRGQNEYGSNIAGPLPRSWMQQQWQLQRDYILPRLSELNIVGQLPAFQGNVPVQVATRLFPNASITRDGATGWIDALDPLYTQIANLWMSILQADFNSGMPGTGRHWYQLDGYLNGGVPPWMTSKSSASWQSSSSSSSQKNGRSRSRTANATTTTTTGVSDNSRIGRDLNSQDEQHDNRNKTGASSKTITTLSSSTTTTTTSHHDDSWYQRGLAAYTALNRTDPDAIWSYQGFAFIGWNETVETASYLRGFIDSAPPNKFVILDMAYSGLGEWTKWNNASFFNASFIWTALHNFGDTMGLKGDLNRINQVPEWIVTNRRRHSSSNAIGIGATPEGIDQNPAFYEFLFDTAFREAPVASVMETLVEQSLRRYGGLGTRAKTTTFNNVDASSTTNHYQHQQQQKQEKVFQENVRKAWSFLAISSYANDQSVQDLTGVAHVHPREEASMFERDRFTAKPMFCNIVQSWQYMIRAAEAIVVIIDGDDDDDNPATTTESAFSPVPSSFSNSLDAFHYDLLNLGREVLAQLTTPMALNFSTAVERTPQLDRHELLRTGTLYLDLLEDLDDLLATHTAFLVGPWIESARKWANNHSNSNNNNNNNNTSDDDGRATKSMDCTHSTSPDSQENDLVDCAHFYEWNARSQITTWNPTRKNALKIPYGPIDYAAKHWSGLVKDYYAVRVSIYLFQALRDDEIGGAVLNRTRLDRLLAKHAYGWTTARNKYPTQPITTNGGGYRNTLNISMQLLHKYSPYWLESCSGEDDERPKRYNPQL
jgi:hypothetical protein